MKVSDVISDSKGVVGKIKNIVAKLPDGECRTKAELARGLGYTSVGTLEKWLRIFPELTEFLCYIPINGGRNRKAIFVNKKYRRRLIDTGKAVEKY